MELFVCAVCLKSFSERRRHTQHKKLHTKPMECQTCSKSFGSRYDLTRHVRGMHRVGLSKFSCDVLGCSVKSKRKDNMLQHVRNEHSSHSSEPDGNSRSLEVPPPLTSNDNDAALDCIISNSSGPLSIGSAFMEAASTGNVSCVNYMLERGIDVEIRAEDGYTALHCASRTGQVAMIKNLLEKGATAESRNTDMNDWRPVHEAIFGKSAEAVAVLLSAGADILTPDWNGRTVIDHVGSAGDIPIAQTLLQGEHLQLCTSEMASKLIISTAKAGKSLLLEWLLSKFPQAIPHPENIQKSPIYIAISRGYRKVLEVLLLSVGLSSATNPNFAKAVSLSLHRATMRGDLAMVKILLKCEIIRVNQKDRYGGNAVQIAVFMGNTQILAQLLCHHECTVDRDKYLLHVAIRRGHTDIVKLLLSRQDVDLNLADRSGNTPLHLSINLECMDVLKLLLDRSEVDSHRKDRNGRTSLELALSCCKWEALRLIANHDRAAMGFDFESTEGEVLNATSDTILSLMECLLDRGLLTKDTKNWMDFVHAMIESGATKLVQLLVDKPWFAVNDCTGYTATTEYTALYIAAKFHRHEIFSILLDHPRIDVNKSGFLWISFRESVLHCAVLYDNMTAIKLLLDRPELSIDSRNRYNQTALDLARQLDRHEMVELLLRHGAMDNVHKTVAFESTNTQSLYTPSYEHQYLNPIAQSATYDEEYMERIFEFDEYKEEDMHHKPEWTQC